MGLVKSLAFLAGVAVMAALTVTKLEELFPAMDRLAWTLLAAAAALWIFATFRLDGWIERRWPGRIEVERRSWLALLIVYALSGLALHLGRDAGGPFLAANAGPAAS